MNCIRHRDRIVFYVILRESFKKSGKYESEDSFQCHLAGILKIILCYTYCIAQLTSKMKMCP